MIIVDNGFVEIYKIDEQTVLIQVKYGAEIDYEKSESLLTLVENKMSSEFGMIINRKEDYSIVPHDVYKVFNRSENLKAIAIVLHDKPLGLPIRIEQKLFKGKLDTFVSIESAHKWLINHLNS